MPNGSGVSWAECLLIIGTGCRVQVISPEPGANAKWQWVTWVECLLIIGKGCRVQVLAAQSVCQQASSLLEIGFQRPSGFEFCIH